MKDLIMKSTKFDILGVISFYLLTKGTNSIKDLADSNHNLADSIVRLSDKVNSLNSRQTSSEF